MYYKKRNKKAPRYDGIDVMPWKVVDVHGQEFSFLVKYKDEENNVIEVVERQWHSYKRASYFARSVSGTAVRV